jgi:hypothetical protein
MSGGLGCRCQISTSVSGLSRGLSFRTVFVGGSCQSNCPTAHSAWNLSDAAVAQPAPHRLVFEMVPRTDPRRVAGFSARLSSSEWTPACEVVGVDLFWRTRWNVREMADGILPESIVYIE